MVRTARTPRSIAAFVREAPDRRNDDVGTDGFSRTMMSSKLRDPIPSPCIGICRLDRDGYCEGCRRSGDEIARWVAMGALERQRLLVEVLPQRETPRR
jgi:predicted Fe-S protein YdhL (DUF1289 family)